MLVSDPAASAAMTGPSEATADADVRAPRRLAVTAATEGRRIVYVRLSQDELAMLDELASAGGGVTRAAVVEEALRSYLPAVDKAGTFIRRPLPPLPPKSESQGQGARRYAIDSAVAAALDEICERHGWYKSEVARHALAELDFRTRRGPDGRRR